MNTTTSKADTCLLVVSTEGVPVMVVPATSIQDAMSQARELLRDERCVARGSIARNGVHVALFAPAIYGDDRVLGFLPVEHGEFIPESQRIEVN